MEISSIKNIGKYYSASAMKNSNSLPNKIQNSPTEEKQKVFASNVCFKGGIPLTKLMDDYRWFVNNDKIPAINAFLKIDAPKESMEGLLRQILNNDELSFKFFDSITDQLRSNSKYCKDLSSKLPFASDILWFSHPQSPYFRAYSKYIDSRYQNAQSVSELLKIRPDWDGDVLLRKHRELYNNDNFELGFVPDSIGKENYQELINYLRSHSQFGFKMHKDIEDIVINNRHFKVSALIDGKSDKNVFMVETGNGEKFIIKIADTHKRSLNDPFSIGTLAKIDTYLTANNCRNSAPIRYYNHDTNTAVYDYINHSKVPRDRDVSSAGKKIPDFMDLGMQQNDTVGANNYFKLDESQSLMEKTFDFKYGIEHEELVSVDNDHATYSNLLAPSLPNYHKELPNAMLGMFF